MVNINEPLMLEPEIVLEMLFVGLDISRKKIPASPEVSVSRVKIVRASFP